MPGPCPQGRPTMKAHKDAKCRERERCEGPGCRLVRPVREAPSVEADEG
jgi:hypothetical protein